MEALNFRRMDERSRRRAMLDPHLDSDFRRILTTMEKHSSVGFRRSYKSRSHIAPDERSLNNMRVIDEKIPLLSEVKEPAVPLSTESVDILGSARLVIEEEPNRLQSLLIDAINCGNLSALSQLVLEGPATARGLKFVTDSPSGSAYKVQLGHLLVLNVCFNPKMHQVDVMTTRNIIIGAYSGVKGTLNGLCHWDCEPDGVHSVSALHLACFYGNFDLAKAAVEAKADPNIRNEKGLTPLHFVTMGPSVLQLTHFLCGHGATAELTSHVNSVSPLHMAISRGACSQSVKTMIVKGHADINAEKRRGLRTPLIQACALSEVATIKCLLDHDADLGYQTPRSQNALHYAVARGDEEVVEALLKQGASTLTNSPDHAGVTPFILAVTEEDMALIRLLMENGKADLDLTNISGKGVWDAAFAVGDEEILHYLINRHKSRLGKETHHGDRMTVIPLSPLHVATRLDDPDTISRLLEFDLDPLEADAASLNCFMHIAAAENKQAVLEQPWENYSGLLLARNRNRDTPMHMVMRHGNADSVKVLLDSINPASLPNHLHTLNLQFCSPLHIAFSRCDRNISDVIAARLNKVWEMRPDLEVAKDTDPSGNTYLHLAARNGVASMCQQLMSFGTNVNQQNNFGNTALYEAALAGQEESVSCILRLGADGTPMTPKVDDPTASVDLYQNNHKHRSVLHAAALGSSVCPTLLSRIVRALDAVDSSLLNETDSEGNTALHLVLRRTDLSNVGDVVGALSSCSFSIINAEGDTPVHTAATNPDKRVIDAVMSVMEREAIYMPLNVANKYGKTALMLAIESGHKRIIPQLIRAGSDLAHRSKGTGDTPLHHLVRLSVDQPCEIERWKEMYEVICQQSAIWWCQRNDYELPEPNSRSYRNYCCFAMKYLTSSAKNGCFLFRGGRTQVHTQTNKAIPLKPVTSENDPLTIDQGSGHTVMQLTTLIGASTMLDTILNTEGVYKEIDYHNNVRMAKYDVTFLTPDTCDVSNDDTYILSCFDTLSLIPDSKVIEFLDITPISQLAANHWARYRWIFILLMVVHISYMGVYCYVGIRLHKNQDVGVQTENVVPFCPTPNASLFPNTQTGLTPVLPFPGLHSLLLIWPIIIACYQLIFQCTRLRDRTRSKSVREEVRKKILSGTSGTLDVLLKVRLLHKQLINISGLFFSISVFLWYALLAAGNIVEVYVLSLSFALGWLYTIAFAKGFETVNSFAVMIRYIIIKDIFKFMFFFVFIFLGFCFAQHAMFLHSATYKEDYPTLMYTTFYVFQMMIGVANPFSAEYDRELYLAGLDVAFPKALYVFFMIITAIVLLNLLIAMMSDTYAHIKVKEGTIWRVSNMKLAIGLERHLRGLKYWARLPTEKDFIVTKEKMTLKPRSMYGRELKLCSERYYLLLPENVTLRKRVSEEERRKRHMEEQVAELSRKIRRIEEGLDRVESALTSRHK